MLEAKVRAEQALREMASRPERIKPSRIYGLLQPLPIEALLYMMTRTARESIRKAVSLYITKLRSVEISVTGSDLMAMGYPRGPRYREIFSRVLEARLDGAVRDLNSEKEWISSHFPLGSH